MSSPHLRVVVADDEGPARRFLIEVLAECGNVTVVGEAVDGDEAVAVIESTRPDVVFLDLQMPGATGLDIARRLPPESLPLIAFVTAYDDYAVEAFEINAIDYVLKPVEIDRLRATLDRARDRQRAGQPPAERLAALARADADGGMGRSPSRAFLDRVPVRRHDETVLVPVRTIASVTADGELLHLTTTTGERFTITHRLHALEARLDPRRFIRLSRGTLANVDLITRISPMPGGTAVVRLTTGQELAVSRIRYKLLRATLLQL